jgi:hypothetical protein
MLALWLQVLAKEFVAVRQQRKQTKPGAATATTAAGLDNTLPADSISLLRHAFILIAGERQASLYVCLQQ